jgi:hypothetical protein
MAGLCTPFRWAAWLLSLTIALAGVGAVPNIALAEAAGSRETEAPSKSSTTSSEETATPARACLGLCLNLALQSKNPATARIRVLKLVPSHFFSLHLGIHPLIDLRNGLGAPLLC